jgi:hypothetical protein
LKRSSACSAAPGQAGDAADVDHLQRAVGLVQVGLGVQQQGRLGFRLRAAASRSALPERSRASRISPITQDRGPVSKAAWTPAKTGS